MQRWAERSEDKVDKRDKAEYVMLYEGGSLEYYLSLDDERLNRMYDEVKRIAAQPYSPNWREHGQYNHENEVKQRDNTQ